MKKIVFTGCSFTAGTGWVEASPEISECYEKKDSPFLWVNLCHANIEKFKNLELINAGKRGASNTEIFENTIDSISEYGSDIDTIVCQWTSVPRYNFNVGFELWDTSEALLLGTRKHDVHLNKGNQYERKYINDLLDRIRVLHHLHWEIVKIVRYTNIILKLSKKNKIKNVFFINGLCPWDFNYFKELTNANPDEYTEFTKTEILNTKTRSDEDIHKLYNLAHQHYRDLGGIQEASWLNLYNSFKSQRSDFNFDNKHPGKISNQRYFEIIQSNLQTN